MADITNLVATQGPAVYYNGDFRNVLETHLKYLREHSDTVVLGLEPHDTYKYEGDLNGLLRKLGIPNQYHWLVMRMNDFNTVTEIDNTTTSLLYPSTQLINEIRIRYMTTLKK